MFGLLQHENKATVVNYTVLRTTEYKEPIRSKDPLILQSGFRRYRINPIFSQNAKRAKNSNNVYKMERFLRHHDSSIMTFYGQVSFAATPALVFKENPANPQGTASVFYANPQNPSWLPWAPSRTLILLASLPSVSSSPVIPSVSTVVRLSSATCSSIPVLRSIPHKLTCR